MPNWPKPNISQNHGCVRDCTTSDNNPSEVKLFRAFIKNIGILFSAPRQSLLFLCAAKHLETLKKTGGKLGWPWAGRSWSFPPPGHCGWPPPCGPRLCWRQPLVSEAERSDPRQKETKKKKRLILPSSTRGLGPMVDSGLHGEADLGRQATPANQSEAPCRCPEPAPDEPDD